MNLDKVASQGVHTEGRVRGHVQDSNLHLPRSPSDGDRTVTGRALSAFELARP